MISQAALYKALSRYFKDNKVDSKDIEDVTNVINESVGSFSETVKNSTDSFFKNVSEDMESTTDLINESVGSFSESVKNTTDLFLKNVAEYSNTLKESANLLSQKIDESKSFSAKYSDSLKESANLLSQKIDESKSFSAKLKSSMDAFEKAAILIGKMADNLDPLIATPIYERVNNLKNSIDVFETQILKKLGISEKNPIFTHRLRNKDRIKVFLISKFSAGKTTFIRRLLSGVSGHTAAPPTTGCLVVHKQSSVPSLVVAFNKEFNIEKSEEFSSFLDNYDLRTFFTNRKDIYISNDTEKVFDKWTDDKILDFLNEANEFPEAFSNVVWKHKKTGKGCSFLDFADLYDMPGIGGNKKHEEVIKNIFNEYKSEVDVVLYLIDTDKGCPSDEELKVLPDVLPSCPDDEELEVLKDILPSIMQSEPLPLFYWVFEKPTEYKQLDMDSIDTDKVLNDEDFLKYVKESDKDKKEQGKKKTLEDFVDDIRKNHTDRFDGKQIIYLAETSVLDARGLANQWELDTEMAQNAVSLVLQDYFCRNTKIYCEKAGKLLRTESNTSQFEVMNYKPDSFGYAWVNPFLQERIFDKIKVSSISIEGIRKIFKETLFIDQPYVKTDDFPVDLRITLSIMIKDIENIIENILGSFTKFWSGNINFDKLNDFWTNYEKNPEWQGLLYKVQSFHWLIAHYRGIVAPQYVNNIGFTLLNNIKNDIKRLEETKIPFSLSAKLFENSP